MPTIYERIRADIVTAMKAGDRTTVTALRTADAAIKRAEMDADREIDDAMVVATLRKAVKNLNDAKEEFARGGRPDLVAANESEVRLLERYLPQGLGVEQLNAIVNEAIKVSGAQTRKEMGKVMSVLKQRPEAGLIDFAAASRLVQARLP